MNPIISTKRIEEKFYGTGLVNSAEVGLCRLECFRLRELYENVIPMMVDDPWILVDNRSNIENQFTIKNPIISGVDHIGIISKYADSIKNLFNGWGILLSESGIVKELGVNCEYYNLNDLRLEIVEPVSESSPLKPYYNNHSSHPIHHIAFRVNCLDKAVRHAESKGFYSLNGKVYGGPRPGEKVTFLSPVQTGGILIEFVEIKQVLT